jgi:hypothetical protein
MSSKNMSRWTTFLLTISAKVDQVDQYGFDKWRLWNYVKITPNLKSHKPLPKWPPPPPFFLFNNMNEVHQKDFQISNIFLLRPYPQTHGRHQIPFYTHPNIQQIFASTTLTWWSSTSLYPSCIILWPAALLKSKQWSRTHHAKLSCRPPCHPTSTPLSGPANHVS